MDFNAKLQELCDKLINSNQLNQYQLVVQFNDLIANNKTAVNEDRFVSSLLNCLNNIKSKTCFLLVLKAIIDNSRKYFDLILKLLLNVVNSNNENLSICIRAISDLLISNDNVRYSIRNSSHPFVIILRNLTDNLEFINQYVYEEIKYVHFKKSLDSAIELLRPVYLNIFLEKCKLKHLVARFLVGILLKQEYNEDVEYLIYLYLAHLHLIEMREASFFDTLNAVIAYFEQSKKDSKYSDDIFNRIFDLLLTLDRINSRDCSNEWRNMTRGFEKNDNLRNTLENGKILELLAINSHKISLFNFVPYFELVKYCLQSYNGRKKEHLAIFYPSLFYYLTCFESNESYYLKYKSILMDIVKIIDDKVHHQNVAFEYAKKDLVSDLIQYVDKDGVSYRNVNKLCAFFILVDDDFNIIKSIIDLFNNISKIWTDWSLIFVAMVLYKMKVSKNQEILNELFKNLRNLATNKNYLNLFIRIFLSVIESTAHKLDSDDYNSVQLVSFQELTKLCVQSSHHEKLIYPHLAKFIQTSNKKVNFKLQYTKAYCIDQIIKYRPDYYAEQLLAKISGLLNFNDLNENTAGVSAMLIDTLGYLCETQITDMRSTWEQLAPKFKQEKRVATITAYCRFMSNASRLTSIKNQLFIEEIIRTLWTMYSKDGVANEVFNALSHFDVTQFKCSYLPATVISKLRERFRKIIDDEVNREKSLDEIFEQVPGSCYLDLFSVVNQSSYEGYSTMLTSLLTNEINTMSRRTINVNREKIITAEEKVEKKERIFEQLFDFLNDEAKILVKESQDATFLLFSYNVPVEKNKEGNVTKRHRIMYWRNYEQMLTNLLTKMRFDESKLNILSKGWNRFIKNAYEGCIEALKVEYQLKIDEQPGLSQTELGSINESIANAAITARNKIIDVFKNALSTDDDDTVSNKVLFALISLINTSSAYISMQKNEALKENQKKFLEIIVDFLLNVKEKSSTQSKVNYNDEVCSTQFLKLFTKTLESAQLLDYLIINTSLACYQFKTSNYLIGFIRNSFNRIANKPLETASAVDGLVYSSYVNNLIKSTKDFEIAMNEEINSVVSNFYDLYSKLSNGESIKNVADSYLVGLTQTLCCLYNEESAFYDEANILKKVIDSLKKDISALRCRVCLTCLAYKSNLVDNEEIKELYQYFQKNENKSNELLAFYLKFLYTHGFADSLKWIEEYSTKWIKDLSNDQSERKLSAINGLLTLISGTSVDTCNILDTPFTLNAELDKALKPENIIRQVLREIRNKNNESLKKTLYLSLALTYDAQMVSTVDSYSMIPNNYDYLDDASVLRQVINLLIELQSSNSDDDASIEVKQRLIIKCLRESCEKSTSKQLPPINWYYFVNTILKSKSGKKCELDLIKLTVYQLSNSNSAFTVFRNLFIDTNYFQQLEYETQLFILSSLKPIIKRLDARLNRLFFNKLKLYFNLKHKHFDEILVTLYGGIISCFSDRSEFPKGVVNLLVEFFKFIFYEYTLTPGRVEDRNVIQKISESFIALNDDELVDELLTVVCEDGFTNQYLIIAYIRCLLVANGNQTIIFLNDIFEIVLSNKRFLNDNEESLLLNTFSFTILKSYQGTETTKRQDLDAQYLNWFIEFMNLIKSIASKSNEQNLDFGLRLFSVFVFTAQIASIAKLNYTFDEKTGSVSVSNISNEELISSLDSLLSQSPWKQIVSKVVDFFILICNSKISTTTKNTLLGCLSRLECKQEFSNAIWFKYAHLIESNFS